jgi:TonB-linked SusC/RagA family outer membrane protein
MILLALFVLAGSQWLQAQGVEITGTVTSSEDGQPLPGVSIVVQGTTIGTATNFDGIYELDVPEDATTLVYSFIGMSPQDVAINGRTTIDVTLDPAAIGLDEVVVTAFGISKNKKALGYSSVEINADETLQKSEPDMLRALSAKVPGVEVRSSGGAPGSATRITIRGSTSFSGDNQPLFVVDGVPYSNVQYNTTSQSTGGGAYATGIVTLDPNEIETTSVLKGAAAAALYGSRAKNGVVVITTKSGNANAKGFSVTLNSSVNFETLSRLPEYQNTYGNGANFNYSNSNGSWGPRFDALDSIPTWDQVYQDVLGWGENQPYVAQPDNVKNLFNTGYVFENSLNVQSGNETTSYNFTVSDLRNTGYIPHSSFKRTSISMGGSTKLWEKITASASASYSRGVQEGGLFGNNQSSDGYGASSFARALWLGRTWIMDPYEDPVTGLPMQPNGDQFDNPLWSWKYNKINTNMDRITGNVRLAYDITSWLSANYNLGVNTFVQKREEIVDVGSRANVFGKEGGITNDDVYAQEMNSQFLLRFDKDVGSKINITGLLGHEVNMQESRRSAYRGFSYITRGIYDINNTYDAIPFGGGKEQRRLVGVFGDLTVGYSNFLYLNVTGRNDWSSTLSPDANSYFYPAASLSFLFSEALGIESNIFNFGKLRASWGKVGQDAEPHKIFQSYDARQTTFPFLGQAALTRPNESLDITLSPEFREDLEFGTQLVFLNNRLGVDVSYYHSKSTDMIYPVFVAPSSGYTNYYTNVGQMDNSGVEIALNVTPVKMSSGLEWDILGTFTMNKNEVKNINDKDSLSYVSQLFGDPASAIIIGEPYGVFYGNVVMRDDNDNILIDQSDGLMIVDPEKDTYGSPYPDFQVGLSNTLSFRGITLSALIDYRHGGKIFSNSVTSLLGRGVTKDTEDRERTVIIPGVYGDPNTYEPLLDASGNTIVNQTQISVNDLYFSSGNSCFAINSAGEMQVYDATVLRLREVSLGYDLPVSVLQNTPIKGLNISFTARNVWFYAPNIPEYTNFDPEVSTYGATNVQGVEYSGAPSTKRYGVNLRITF